MPRGHARKRSRTPSAARASESTQEAHASARTSLSALARNRARGGRLSGSAARWRERARCPHTFLAKTARARRDFARFCAWACPCSRARLRARARRSSTALRVERARAPRGALACAGRGAHALARGRRGKRAHKRARASAARAQAGPRGIPTRTSARALARERARACACACARGRAARGSTRERARAPCQSARALALARKAQRAGRGVYVCACVFGLWLVGWWCGGRGAWWGGGSGEAGEMGEVRGKGPTKGNRAARTEHKRARKLVAGRRRGRGGHERRQHRPTT